MKNFTNKKLSTINLFITIIILVISISTFVFTKRQTIYTEKATWTDRINQELVVNTQKEYCKNNPEENNSGIYDNKYKELSCSELNNFNKKQKTMNIIYLIIAIIIGIIIGSYFGVGKKERLIFGQSKKKQENKEKILKFLQNKEKMTNNDVEKLCGVSHATAERYLDQLEKDGKLTQHGKIGTDVFYTLK